MSTLVEYVCEQCVSPTYIVDLVRLYDPVPKEIYMYTKEPNTKELLFYACMPTRCLCNENCRLGVVSRLVFKRAI